MIILRAPQSARVGGANLPACPQQRGDESYPIEVFERSLEAKRAGLSPLYVSQLETKRRSGSTRTLRRIADALAVDIDLLVPRSSD